MSEAPYERRYREAPCGLLSTTIDGIITDANESFSSMTGLAEADLVGRDFAALLEPGSRLFYATRHSPVLQLNGRVDQVALTLVSGDGARLPVLINSVLANEHGSQVIRTAVFDATERLVYERELLQSRRLAESSEARVRVLQGVSSVFGVSANDAEVVEAFANVAREAFAANEVAVLLADDSGEMHLATGTNPLEGAVSPVLALRHSEAVTTVTRQQARDVYPELAAALGARRRESLSITPLFDDQERLGILVCFFARRDEFDEHFFELQRALGRQASQTLVRVRLQRRLAHLALYDQLTGLANRQLLQQGLDAALDQADRSGRPLALIFIDVDEFKSINDRLGHAAGDAVLGELGARLSTAVRPGDIVGRIGGDEFVVICGDADAAAATSIAERIGEVARQPLTVTGEAMTVTVSLGVSSYVPGSDAVTTRDELLRRADDAMYVSKGAGKDRVTFERVLTD